MTDPREQEKERTREKEKRESHPAVLLSFLFSLSLFSQEADELIFVVHTVDGTITGSLEKLAEDFSLRLGGAKPALVAGTDLVGLRRQGLPLASYPARDLVLLSNGDRL